MHKVYLILSGLMILLTSWLVFYKILPLVKNYKQESQRLEALRLKQELLLDRATAFLMKEEGFRSRAYNCGAGVLTIGYGETVGVKLQKDLKFMHGRITEEQARKLLQERVEKLIKNLKSYRITSPENKDKYYSYYELLDVSQLTSLISLTYNIGEAAFKSSKLRALIDSYLQVKIQRDTQVQRLNTLEGKIYSEFSRWVRVRNPESRVLSGLQSRRSREANLFIKQKSLILN
jgi:GH24 family phage-related lysozyme (muramidase)